MTKKFQRYLTTIIGTLATVVLSLISDFILKLPVEITWLTFFVGSIVTITITFLEQRLIEVTERELDKKLEIYKLLDQLQDPEMLELAKQATDECVNRLHEYNSGLISTDDHIYTVYNKRIAMANRKVQSLFWAEKKQAIYDLEDSYRGRTYSQKQIEAIERGVEIERIFVLRQEDFQNSDGNFQDKKALEILKKHEGYGINVRVSWVNDWKSSHGSQDWFYDFGIFDENEVVSLRYGVMNSRHGTEISKIQGSIQNNLWL